MYVCARTACKGQKRASDPKTTGLLIVVSGQTLETNLGPLEEQVVLLIVQSVLQLTYFNILVLCLGRLWRK